MVDCEWEKVHSILYKSLVGSLCYFTSTRLDIPFGVGLVSYYMKTPTMIHMKITKKSHHYIKGILNYDQYY